ncbi:MAG: hypothetical protein AAF478_03465 [Pseudomonadota bacterium]
MEQILITQLESHLATSSGLQQALWLLTTDDDHFTNQTVREAYTATLLSLGNELEKVTNLLAVGNFQLK